MSVQLPPGLKISPSTQGMPYGAGRPVRPDAASAPHQARSEIAREQNSGPGRPTIFKDGAELLHACQEYFLWVDEHPMKEARTQFVAKRGVWANTDLDKKRPYSLNSLYFYLAIPPSTWAKWRKMEKFKEVVEEVERCIKIQQLDGAMSGFFNPNIVARLLGLAEKTEVSGPDGEPIQQIKADMSPDEASEMYRRMREG